MKQVYLTEYDDLDKKSQIFSSLTKAFSHFNREYNHPVFCGRRPFYTVSVDGTSVGWITKKMVQ